MTLTVYSEMQYDVQNDCPCCGYSRKFWSLVTSTVCAASFTLAQWATVKSSSMTLAVSIASNQAATVEQHWTYFAGLWQTGPLWYPCLGSVIPFPVPFTWVWNVECFGQRLLSRWKLRWAMLALCAGATHAGLLGWIPEVWGQQYISTFLLQWQKLIYTPDAPCAVSRVWSWLSPGW